MYHFSFMKQRDQRSIQVIIFQRAKLIRINKNKIDLAEKIDIFNNIQNNRMNLGASPLPPNIPAF